MDSATLREIARLFLPSRWHYHYARSKLAADPLYAAVVEALAGTKEPLLDLGCGIGLLPHYCRVHGVMLDYLGVDNDSSKIALARQAAAKAGLASARFDAVDLTNSFPVHHGSVAILDMLQFLPAERVCTLLGEAADCVTEAGRLVIRTGVQDLGWRTRVTRAADILARVVRWMNAGPQTYPTRELLISQLSQHGLETEFAPLWGKTPFNNWLIVARRKQATPSPATRFADRELPAPRARDGQS